jgi:hypothetical protein
VCSNIVPEVIDCTCTLHEPGYRDYYINQMNKTHSWAIITLLHVSAPRCHREGVVQYKAV